MRSFPPTRRSQKGKVGVVVWEQGVGNKKKK